jgi:outer membrane cobalamin receptor
MGKRFVSRYLYVLLLFTCSSCAALAATLEGTALDPSGKAVPGARVSLLRSLVAIAECQTDARGAYKFEGLQEGAYQITAVSRGLSSPSVELNLKQEESKKQDVKLEVNALNSQVVVSASLGGALIPQVGSSVSLVSLQEIEDRGAQNALEVVRGLPGLEVSQSGRRGGVTGVYIRGGESKYNAVMLDGIPLNEFGGGFDFASMPADGIERVEVTRGPQSALYGSNAVAGVVNLISRRGEGSPSFTALAEGGSYNTRRFATGGSGLSKGFSWSYNLSRTNSDGVVANDNYRNQSAFVSLGYKQNRRQFDFHFFGNANDAGATGPYGSDPNGNFASIGLVKPEDKVNKESRGKQNLFGYQLAYVERLSTRLRQVTTISSATNYLFYHTYDMFWMSRSNYTSDNLRVVANTRSEISLSDNNTLSAGFEFNHEETEQGYTSNYGNDKYWIPRNSYAYFVEDRWDLSKRLFVTAGVRVDNLHTDAVKTMPSSSVTKINPRISLAYITPSRIRIHGSFGTGIRPPDGFQLSTSDNANLKPEKSVSFDSGVEQSFFGSRAVVDVTYFYNHFDDLIISLGGSYSDFSKYKSTNLNNSRAQGIETTFRLRPFQSLELSASYTFLDSSILALDGLNVAKSNEKLWPYHVGDSLLRRPDHSASYNITWRRGRLMLNTNAYMRGSVRDVDPINGTYACYSNLPCFFSNDGYIRADAGFSFRMARGVELYARINNFLNRKYEESLGFPANHANVMGGVKFALSTE